MDRTLAPTVIVLASGRGERFVASGGQGSKLQAPLAGRPVLERTLDAVRASGLPFHVEAAGHPGMGDSIAAAVRATRGAAGWLILPGDLPLVKPATLVSVAGALHAGGNEVVVPVYRGQRGHPVAFPQACGDSLAALAGPRGAASVVGTRPVREVEVEDEGVVVDIDTVEALAEAELLLEASVGTMKIRPAVPADAADVSSLIRSLSHLFTVSPDGEGAEAFFQTIGEQAIRSFIEAPNFCYLVGEQDSRLAGVVAVRDRSHLHHLFVAPAFQQRGLGRRLWTTARDKALAEGNPGGFTVNASLNAVPVYERFGFVATGPRVETRGIAFVPMRWKAAPA